MFASAAGTCAALPQCGHFTFLPASSARTLMRLLQFGHAKPIAGAPSATGCSVVAQAVLFGRFFRTKRISPMRSAGPRMTAAPTNRVATSQPLVGLDAAAMSSPCAGGATGFACSSGKPSARMCKSRKRPSRDARSPPVCPPQRIACKSSAPHGCSCRNLNSASSPSAA